MILKDVNKNDLIVMADIKDNGNYRFGSLILFDSKTKGFVELTGYYHTGTNGNIDGTANGEIETIKAGNSKINASGADIYENFNTVKQVVANWLCGNGHSFGAFDNVAAVLESKNSEAINSLVACFTNN